VRLLAADTALPVLREAGLSPDAAVAVEAQHANLADFAGLRGAPLRLFADLTSLPGAARLFEFPPCWFLSEFAPVPLFADPAFPPVPRIPPLGSVGVAAAWIAWRLSRGPVVLAGVDFCYPPGRTHARGAPALRGLLARTGRFVPASQPGTWLREGLKATASGWITSPAMEGYGAILGDQARSEVRRTFVWDRTGLPLGLEVWDRRTGGPLAGDQTPAETGVLGGAAEWIEGRRALWRRLLEGLEGPVPSSDRWTGLLPGLEACGELFFSFPDPEPRRAADWLARAKVQLRWALDRTGGL